MAAFSCCKSGIWFRRPNPLSRSSSKSKSNLYKAIECNRTVSQEVTIYHLFATMCQLEPALLSEEEIYEHRHKPYTIKQSQKKATQHFERCFAVSVWLCLLSCLYFCHPFLRCDSCCLETKTNAVLQTLIPRILTLPLAPLCACVCVCMLKRADMVGDRTCLVGRYTCLSVWERSKFLPLRLINPTHTCHPFLSCSRFRHTMKPSWAPSEYITGETSWRQNCDLVIILIAS